MKIWENPSMETGVEESKINENRELPWWK